MITLKCKLTFEKEKDRKRLIELMKRFTSCHRYAYKRLLEGEDRKNLKKHLQEIFELNSRYCDDAILKASSLLKSCNERGQNPKKVVFGGRNLFEKLKKKHLTEERRRALRQKWEERRKGYLYSRGDKAKKGNLNARIILDKDGMKLRINAGQREWITANIKRKVTRENDKWIEFTTKLIIAERTGEFFPYTIEVRRINGQIYAFISYEETLPPTTITTENGSIGIDINAKPFHIAIAIVNKYGNLEKYERIPLNYLINKTRNQREYLSWQIAKQVVETAVSLNKAIVMEDLKKIPKGERGDGMAKLRKIKQQWIYRGILEKIDVLAKRKGIEVRKVNPAYTSVIGMFKYSPQHHIDKDIAGAYVIGRRGLGYKEKLPRKYKELLENEEFINYAVNKIGEEREKTREKLKRETNQYKKKPLRRRIKKMSRSIKLFESLDSEPQTQQTANQWKERLRDHNFSGYKLWQAIKVALTIPILGKVFPRDLSPLKPILVEGAWDRVVRRRVPVSWDGDYGVDKYRLPGSCPHLKRRNINSPAPNCDSFIQFG